MENIEAEYYLQASVIKSGVCDSCNIANMDIQCKVVDASDLQSGGGTAGASDGHFVHQVSALKNNHFS